MRPRSIGLVLLAVLLPLGATSSAGPADARPGLLPCDDPAADPWVRAQRDRIVAWNTLETFAAERFGPISACTGEKTGDFDGATFGTVELTHVDGAVVRVETLPPETSIVSLAVPTGFPDEAAAREALEAYARGVGVHPDWGHPVIDRGGALERRAYADPEPGLNAAAWLVYRGETLVELRLTLAL